jgi:hypothetical protein
MNRTTAKPVTPKTLMRFISGSWAEAENNMMRKKVEVARVRTENRNRSGKKERRTGQSPIPGFMQDFMQEDNGPHRTQLRSVYYQSPADRTRINTSKPARQRLSITMNTQRAQTSPISELRKNTAEIRVFRMYKPQVLQISPRAKMKIYSNIEIPQNAKPSRKKIFNVTAENLRLPHIILKSPEGEKKVEIIEPIEYLQPAITFGEKLWRLNEVSLISGITK